MLPDLCELLKPFDITLSELQAGQVATYLELLIRWNKKINLTSIRSPEECVTRHFGESFLLCHAVHLEGNLLDVGSGAGFPGVALKILQPELHVTLLEPVGKKRAFLKEVARACDLSNVKPVGSTLEEFSRQRERGGYDLVTMRAVGRLAQLLPHVVDCLEPQGHVCLWVGSEQVEALTGRASLLRWSTPVPIPLSQRRYIMVGAR